MATNKKISETITENIFRTFYGPDLFLEKSAIPAEFGFKSKAGTDYAGYPDFFKELEEYVVVVEAKAVDHIAAEDETQFYMTINEIRKDIIGIAISGQSKNSIRVSYYFKQAGGTSSKKISSVHDVLLSMEDIEKLFRKEKYGDSISTEALMSVLKELNSQFHKDGAVRSTERSLFFSGLMIALNNQTFRNTYMNIEAPSKDELASVQLSVLEAHNLNNAIIDAISSQLRNKINSLSKEFSWQDQFSFIKNIAYPLGSYKKIIKTIETKIFKPFKNDEKQDILGRAYKIFLSRAGKAENKNIILTPDHIKSLMVSLADLCTDDVVLDTCTGSGGFLMESMEKMTRKANGNSEKIAHIKERQLIGFEIDSVLFSLACSNMFLHGDGKTNLLYRSSQLNSTDGSVVNSTDKDLLAFIKGLKPTKVIINPPYENNSGIKFAIQAIEYLEPDGKLIIIMPTPSLTQNQGGLTDKLLSMAKLDFVIKMPDNLFSEQQRGVHTSIFGFTKKPHYADRTVLFYDLDDDGLKSVQHKGKVDVNKKWDEIEKSVLDCVRDMNEIPGVAIKKKIFTLDGKLCCSGTMPKIQSQSGYPLVKISDLFFLSRGELASEKANLNGTFDFITAAEEWKKHDKHTHDTEALIYAVSSSGSLGRCHYVNGKFVASNLCLILTPKQQSAYQVNLAFSATIFR